MKFCYVCKNKDNECSYHKFPTDPKSRNQWLKACRFKENDIFKNTRICSKHFAATCFADTPFGRPRLIKGSIPTLHLPKLTRKNGSVYTSVSNESRCTSAAVTKVEVTTPSKNVTTTDYIPSSLNIDTPRENVDPLEVPITEPYIVARQLSLSALPSKPKRTRLKKNFNSLQSVKWHYDHIREKFLRLSKEMKKIKRQNVALRQKITSLQGLVVHLKENAKIASWKSPIQWQQWDKEC